MAHSILIIEDDKILADNIRVYLERFDWETCIAHNAETGLKKLESMRPDVVVTDQMLPGKSGLDVIKAALVIDPQIKIIMLTGDGNTRIAVDQMKAGPCEY